MENWGLVTFRETSILSTDKTAMSAYLLITETIAHELAHQWFGNLVTMQWWNDLWLNESFATFVSQLVVDKLYPEQKFMQGL